MQFGLSIEQDIEKLVQGALSADEKCKKRLYEMFSSKMYAVCLRYASNRDDARDLLQEGFIKVFQNLQRYRGEGSFEGWIRRIVVNTCLEYIRRTVKDQYRTDLADAEDIHFDAHIYEGLQVEVIMEAIQALAPGYRTVFNLYVIEGYSHKEIAAMLNINENTSKSQLARARGVLQQQLLKLLK